MSGDVIPFNTRRVPFNERKGADLLPDGKRMMVLLNVACEEWSGDTVEPYMPSGFFDTGMDTPSLSTRTIPKYAFEVGLPRILDVLDEHDITTTLVSNGLVLDRYPEVMKDGYDRGHEIMAHGWSEGTPHVHMDRDEVEEDIRKTTEVIEDVTGEPPVGWLGPGADCTPETLEILAEYDYLYTGDLHDDELPYLVDVGDDSMVAIPFRIVGMCNDIPIFTTWETRMPYDEVLQYLKQKFDAVYRESSTRPVQFRYAVHPYISGFADTAFIYSEFLDYITSFDDVWVTSYKGAAEYWMENFDDGYPV